jgi:hypothetical protein
MAILALVLFIAMIASWTMLPGSISTSSLDQEVEAGGLPAPQQG